MQAFKAAGKADSKALAEHQTADSDDASSQTSSEEASDHSGETGSPTAAAAKLPSMPKRRSAQGIWRPMPGSPTVLVDGPYSAPAQNWKVCWPVEEVRDVERDGLLQAF